VNALDRRQFLVRAAALLAATAGLGVPGAAVPAPALAAGGAALTPRRRATYRALLATLREAPDGRFRHRDAAAGARAFADWYAAQPEAARLHADAVLDGVAEQLPMRYAALRDRPGGATPPDDEARRRALLVAAVCLVEGPAGPEDERSATGALA
jgi:hypothetical protein